MPKKRRKNRKLMQAIGRQTYRKFARKAGLSTSTINEVIHGKPVRYTTAVAIGEALGWAEDQLDGWLDEVGIETL